MKNSFVLYTDYLAQIELLTMEQRGVLLTAIMKYQAGEELPDADPVTEMAFSFIKANLDKDNERYERTIEARSEAGKTGGRPRKDDTEKQTKAKKANAFSEKQNNPVYVFDSVFDTVIDSEKDRRETHKEKAGFPPTVEDVREYCQSAGLDSVDPAFFVNFYAARGWMMGRSKMHDWRSAVISWNLDARKAGRSARAPTKFSNFRARDEDFDKIAMDILRQQEKEAENEHSDSDGQINA